MSKGSNISINDDMKLTIQSTTKVTCNDKIIMFFPGGKKEELNVKIEADFSKLKPEHHEIFLQSFTSKYNHPTGYSILILIMMVVKFLQLLVK